MTEQEIAELQKKAHAYDSDKGRLQKVQSDLEAERAQRAELEARLAAAAQQQATSRVEYNPVEVFGEDGYAALKSILEPLSGKLDTVNKKLEERDNKESQASAARRFQEELNKKLSDNNLPHGFASRLYNGDLTSVWASFAESHPAVRRAQAEGDVETVSDMMNIFIHQNKELVAGGGFSQMRFRVLSPV